MDIVFNGVYRLFFFAVVLRDVGFAVMMILPAPFTIWMRNEQMSCRLMSLCSMPKIL